MLRNVFVGSGCPTVGARERTGREGLQRAPDEGKARTGRAVTWPFRLRNFGRKKWFVHFIRRRSPRIRHKKQASGLGSLVSTSFCFPTVTYYCCFLGSQLSGWHTQHAPTHTHTHTSGGTCTSGYLHASCRTPDRTYIHTIRSALLCFSSLVACFSVVAVFGIRLRLRLARFVVVWCVLFLLSLSLLLTCCCGWCGRHTLFEY